MSNIFAVVLGSFLMIVSNTFHLGYKDDMQHLSFTNTVHHKQAALKQSSLNPYL